jgi:hypothetical protein
MHYEDRLQLEKWAQIIEKAQADGKFDKPKEIVPSKKTSEESFFGLHNTHPTDKPAAEDVAHWNQVTKKAENPFVLNETEVANQDVANVAKSIAQSPNPIRQHTVGTDQALEPGPLGLTFSEEDIKVLEALKVQLYEMECGLNAFESQGKNSSKYEKQIKSIKEKIDALSTAMTQSFPYSISPQGD